MKLMLLIFAISLCAAAQTIVGLPQHGVSLAGDIQHPAVANVSSGKEILAVTLDFTIPAGGKGGGKGPLITEYFLYALGASIHPGETRSVHGYGPTAPSGETITGVVLDNVIFADGLFVGPDRRSGFEEMGQYLAAMAQTAGPLLASGNSAAAWGKIHQLAGPAARKTPAGADPMSYGAQRDAALNLMIPHMAGNDVEALQFAERLASLPALHKAN